MPGKLVPVDRAQITILSDNYCEQVILSSEMVFRPGGLTVKPGEEEVRLKAEHGFAAAVRLYRGDEVRTILVDTGRSGEVLLNNADFTGFNLADVEAVMISHGHPDHVGGLSAAAGRFSGRIPVIVHPDAFNERYVVRPGEHAVKFREFSPEDYTDTCLDFHISREPVYMVDDMAVATGEIPRITSYEKGFPPQMAMKNGELVPDSLVSDDQSLVFSVKGKGPVIISGCGHAGIINSVKYALKLSGEAAPLAVVGGFHLCWPTPEHVVENTLEDMRNMAPRYILPCHCTGWEATHLFSREFDDSFILSTVGCTVKF